VSSVAQRPAVEDQKSLVAKIIFARAPPASLQRIHDVLIDLSRVLDHVDRLVAPGTTKPIPSGIWDLEPGYFHDDFRRWIEDFDAAHPGRLSWLASNYADTIASLYSTVAPKTTTVTGRRVTPAQRVEPSVAPSEVHG